MKISLFMLIGCFSTLFANSSDFQKFTGRVIGNKVRVRLGADFNSGIVQKVNKDDLVLVVGEKENFWAIRPFELTKVYVYRTYILDGIVEASRVNIRLKPQLDAPILGVLQMGERVHGAIDENNPKWYAITPPKQVTFYIDKKYVELIGKSEIFAPLCKQKKEAENVLKTACMVVDEAVKKEIDAIDPGPIIETLSSFIKTYSSFPKLVQTASDTLDLFKEQYTKKKIEQAWKNKAHSENSKEPIFASVEEQEKHQNPTVEETLPSPKVASPVEIYSISSTESNQDAPASFPVINQETSSRENHLAYWQKVEEARYEKWKKHHAYLAKKDYYEKQKLDGFQLEGFIEKHEISGPNKPGDFLLRSKNQPVGYLYSADIDLSFYEGRSVKIIASERPNYHFAFPAYYVLEIE